MNHLTQALAATDKTINSQEDKYQVFADYILNNLETVIGSNNESTDISFIGSEVENKYFYIYQEYTGDKSSNTFNSLSVDISAMKNRWKPKYWLFHVELPANLKESFVLDNNSLSHKATD
nr:DUF6702 family protein [Kangiella sp. HZ709]